MQMLTCRIEDRMEQDRIDVVRGLRSADPEVIAILIERYQHRLFRYLLALSADHSLASDLFQETWLRVLERGNQYRGQWKFESWLFAVARHLFIDRARRKDPASLDELVSPGDDGGGLQPEAGEISPLDRLISGEERERVSRSLSRIPTVQREVLVLRFHEELSLGEIAVVVGVPLSTIKSRLYRGLDALRQTMEERR
jgi:RNA polymerase sigma-70 factor, ECF subfamily